LDSVRLGANASSDKKMTEEELRKQLQDLDEYLRRTEASDEKEDAQYGPEQRGDELPAELRSAQRRKEKLQEALEILEQRPPLKRGEGRKDVSPADAEAVWLKKKEKDEFICPAGKRLTFFRNHRRRTATKIYRGLDCQNYPARSQCTERADGIRHIEVRPDHAEIRKIRQRLKTEQGTILYKKRKAIIEPIFGRWQHNWGVRRLRLSGLSGFSIELHLLAIAHNLTKLCRMQQTLAASRS
jgi:hypothetical protein